MRSSYTFNYPRELAIGFDELISRLQSFNDKVTPTNYPPYNLYKVDENRFVFELAVAGFHEDELSVTLHESELVIVGSKSAENEVDISKYVYRGMAGRNFTRKFILADTVVVKDVTLSEGILRVFLENVIPDSKKPVKFAINKPTTSEPQLLTE